MSKSNSNRHEIVIIGAGIIGVMTAYYLTRHPKFDANFHHITIIEAARPAGGASGKAGGLLALWAFPKQIVPLSFELHRRLAEEYNGAKEWGYRRLDTVSLEGDLSKDKQPDADSFGPERARTHNSLKSTQQPDIHTQSIGAGGNSDAGSPASSAASADSSISSAATSPNSQGNCPPGLDWVRESIIEEWSMIGTKETTAQVHPYLFTNFLLKKAQESGAVDIKMGKVTSILTDPSTGEANGVVYTTKTSSEPVHIAADQVVAAMGPWTSKLLLSCPIKGLRAHSITIEPSRQVTPIALFTEIKLSRRNYVSPEIYPRFDEVYVCGEGDTLAPMPETTDDVEVIREKCDALFEHAGQISDELRHGRILRRQACYLPVVQMASVTGPFIGETNVSNLFLASGHSCWGINNAPATGKLMSEILLEGRAKSASIDGLEPKFCFDASDIAC